MDKWKYKKAGDFGMPMTGRMRSVRRESGLVSSLTRHGWWLLVKSYLAAGHRLSISGRENLPARPPFILVANHSSHLDVMMLAAVMPIGLRERAYPIAAGDTFFETKSQMLFATMMLNALPMWRKNCGRHAIEDLRQKLIEEDCIYLLFPEGTRSRDGTMGRFKPGVGMLVAGTDIPIIPCHLAGAFRALPSSRKLPRLSKLRVTIGPAMNFSEIANERAGWNEIASQLQGAIESLSMMKKSMVSQSKVDQ